jgi:hypothetical protein
MKPYHSDEDLEQALFALPLEEPPTDLRASILAATIYRTPFTVKPWEVWLFGALLALLTWALVLVATGGAMPTIATVSSYALAALTIFATPQTLFWIAVGGAAALWASQLNLTITPEALRATRR